MTTKLATRCSKKEFVDNNSHIMGMIEGLRVQTGGLGGQVALLQDRFENIERICVGREEFDWYKLH